MSYQKPSWDKPTNVKVAAPDLASVLAARHGISIVRAQMLIDRLGTNVETLDEAAKDLKINPER